MNRLSTLQPLLVIALLTAFVAGSARAQTPPDSSAEVTTTRNPLDTETPSDHGWNSDLEGTWFHAPGGDDMLTDFEPWRSIESRDQDLDFLFDYNRADPLRLGFGWRYRGEEDWMPRLGARLERAFGRDRTLYGAQVEQPVIPNGRIAVGASMTRRTDHLDLQQSGDLENSIALLLARRDQRDYFEREGAGAYVVWRVPDFSAISVHLRTDQYRSLPDQEPHSWAHGGRTLRPNPAIDDGEAHAWLIRLDRPTRIRHHARAGLYHWIELERTGHGMGGDFNYTRGLADVRSVVRLSPASTLSLRGVAGDTFDGNLPAQKQFSIGGPDGLRAHAVDSYRGNQVAIGQAEYDVGLWWSARGPVGGFHALTFLDLGSAWNSDTWDLTRQKYGVDGGFGIATSENALRIYLAKDLQDLNQDFVISARLQRPF